MLGRVQTMWTRDKDRNVYSGTVSMTTLRWQHGWRTTAFSQIYTRTCSSYHRSVKFSSHAHVQNYIKKIIKTRNTSVIFEKWRRTAGTTKSPDFIWSKKSHSLWKWSYKGSPKTTPFSNSDKKKYILPFINIIKLLKRVTCETVAVVG